MVVTYKACGAGSAVASTRSPRSSPASGASARSRSRTTTTRSPSGHAARRSRPGRSSLWRYADLLPVARDPAVDLGTGFTPLVRADRLAAELGLGEVWIKNDTRNPTNSFKDRVVSVALSKALEFGFKVAACASTGNLANSVAAHAAHAGLRSYVFIPSNLEQGKIVTTSVYGGNVVAIEGNYDDVNRLCAELAGIYDVGVREREHAAVLRRGLQDARVRDRRAARLGSARPRGRAGRERFAAHQDPARASTSCTRSACSTTSRTCACRARRRSVARRSRPRSSTSPTRSGR